MSEEQMQSQMKSEVLTQEERIALDQLHKDLTEATKMLRDVQDLILEPLGRVTRVLNAEAIKNYLDSKLGNNTRETKVELPPPRVLDDSGDDSKFFDFTNV